MELSWLSWLYQAVAQVIIWIHTAYSTVLNPDSGLTWALTIITLTAFMRILIFPLFLKQMRSSRKMQELAPKVQELRKRYKNDKQRMNQEVMALYQGAGANPLGGCLPVLAQFPIFISMFTVLQKMANGEPSYGMTQDLVDSARSAHIFGAPLPAHFWMSAEQLTTFQAGAVQTKIVLGIFVAISSLTTFLTVRQSVTRSMAQMPDNPMAQQQKILMYISPLFAIFSLNFPLGLILYWVTTNVWTLGQQHWFYSRYPMPQYDAKGNVIPTPPKQGLIAKIRKTPPEEQAPPPPPEPKIIRQQPSRQPRSKRTGSKKS
ncbi:membrane protein insertase YidC [Nonomuraea sp. KC401]|uniref:Membrane protein insertase YidC n=1 Tax=Nonomuraea longispora TaxID=1848320 RepID=A0A4R4NMN2_9ACTN|nr:MULTISPECIES: membrane protein insertase YidC [Nonomuraea]NBE93135.1 membrane protein insertase YidC [Nonomuraea sp. K271]TDC10731.1 membrane protein insertase YidC [Nonomuraea longispora]TLF82881.1 membrane protein insertase YidC [Nonomuraea sp. KC401]